MENPLKLKRIHHVEFWVGNARQAAFYYRKGFGFSQVAYRGLETGQRQRTSYALSQGKANFLLTTPMTPEDPAADHIRKHGDGVRDIALEVGNELVWRLEGVVAFILAEVAVIAFTHLILVLHNACAANDVH